MPTTEVAIDAELPGSCGRQTADNGAWAVRYYKPFVRWIWFGEASSWPSVACWHAGQTLPFVTRRPRHEIRRPGFHRLPLHHLPDGAVFLFKGSTRSHHRTVMVDKEVPVFSLQDIYDLGKSSTYREYPRAPHAAQRWATVPDLLRGTTYLKKELAGRGSTSSA